MAMIDEYVVLEAVKSVLENNSEINKSLNSHSKAIRINTPINEDYTKAPWIGIYHNRNRTLPHTTGRKWLQRLEMNIVVQSSSGESADLCMRKLTKLVKEINSTITDKNNLKGKVDAVVEIDTAYTNIEGEDAYFQVALINVIAEVRNGAG